MRSMFLRVRLSPSALVIEYTKAGQCLPALAGKLQAEVPSSPPALKLRRAGNLGGDSHILSPLYLHASLFLETVF